MKVLISILLLSIQAPSEKDQFDSFLNPIREIQLENGSYGNDPTITANIVTAMALSPRAYRIDDGPFMSKAIDYLLKQLPEELLNWEVSQHIGQALHVTHSEKFAKTIDQLLDVNNKTLNDLYNIEEILKSKNQISQITPEMPLREKSSIAAYHGILSKLSKENPQTANYSILALARRDYEKGVNYLLSSRGESGLWEVFGQPQPGISAIAARGLLGSERPEIRKEAYPVLDWLLTLQKEDGSIHDGRVAVYTTSVAIGALIEGEREDDISHIKRAVAYLRAIQTDESEGYSPENKFYGGIGYGGDLRPDLSNLQYALQALHEANVSKEDPAFQRAMYFLNRSQNHSESNFEIYYDQASKVPTKAGNDGGAAYYPGNSPAGYNLYEDGTRVARSYGSMTYALLKCYIFAGLTKEDPRVQAAKKWIEKNYTLEVNPGFDPLMDPKGGFQGLYYYYQTLAQTLNTLNVKEIVDREGNKHLWANELIDKLHNKQLEDGSWVNNDASRWWEGNPDLCTGYALSALRAIL